MSSFDAPFAFVLDNIHYLPMNKILKYSYYDTPDGHDIHKKIAYTLSYAMKAGAFNALWDIMLLTRPENVLPTIVRYVHIITPYAALAITYPVAAGISARLRGGKQSPINHGAAAVACAMTLGTIRQNWVLGWWCVIPFTFIAMNFNYFKFEYNINYVSSHVTDYPRNLEQFWNCRYYKQDYTIFEKRPKQWVRAEDLGKQ